MLLLKIFYLEAYKQKVIENAMLQVCLAYWMVEAFA
jgi:hypothetical protein